MKVKKTGYHVRIKTCVNCGSRWQLIWHDKQPFIERSICPLCETKKPLPE